jgi:glycosyltransferase involved in cell wall biosynthesis
LWNKFHVLNFENFAPGKIDIYHSSDWAQAPDSSLKVTTVHDLAPLLFPKEHDRSIVDVQKSRLHWVVSECDHIICVSKNTANDLSNLFPQVQKKLTIIPEALPQRFLHKPKKSPFSDYLVAIGARQPRKNIHKLISAFIKHQKSKNIPPKLVIIGEVSEKIVHPSVFYTGYVPDNMLTTLLAGAECFVYPSLYEGFGLPILGAFHHQVPVACSNTSSLPETAGNAAVYFDPHDEESIIHGIALAVKNRKKLISLGLQQLKSYSWNKTAIQTLRLYESLL